MSGNVRQDSMVGGPKLWGRMGGSAEPTCGLECEAPRVGNGMKVRRAKWLLPHWLQD